MAITQLQKKTAEAIVNVFETGKALGDYGRVTYVPSDPGQLTYGRSQTTLASGSLYLLIKAYCDTPGAVQADELRPYLPLLEDRAQTLNTDMTLRGLLHAAGDDPAMRDCQDGFFDRGYWTPAANAAAGLGLEAALSQAVVYDSFIHGSWKAMRDRTLAAAPMPGSDPRAWTRAYVATRRAWLAGSSNPLLQKCVYRMDAFNDLMDKGAWDLPLPLVVRGVSLTEALFEGGLDQAVSAQDPSERLLKLTQPLMRGEDVAALQRALKINDDGVFGPGTAQAVKAFQASKGLTADGAVGPATRQALGL